MKKCDYATSLILICLTWGLIAASPASAQPIFYEPGLTAAVFAQDPLLDLVKGLESSSGGLYSSTSMGKICFVSWEGDVVEVADLRPSSQTLGGIAMSPEDTIMVCDSSYQQPGVSLYEVTPAGTVSLLRNDLSSPSDIHFDENGDLLVVERFGIAGVSRVARDGSWREVVLRAADIGIQDHPTSLELDQEGNLYVAYRVTGSIYRMSPEGTTSLFATVPSSNIAIDLCFDPFGDLLASNSQTGEIFNITPEGDVSLFASGLQRPRHMAFDASGTLYFADGEAGVIYQVVPEPATMSLLALGGVAMLKRRK